MQIREQIRQGLFARNEIQYFVFEIIIFVLIGLLTIYPMKQKYTQSVYSLVENNICPNIGEGLNFVTCEQTFNVIKYFFKQANLIIFIS